MPPPLRHLDLLAPAQQWLVTPHCHPSGKDHSASFSPILSCFICFAQCQEPCWVLPSSEPFTPSSCTAPSSSFCLLWRGWGVGWGVRNHWDTKSRALWGVFCLISIPLFPQIKLHQFNCFCWKRKQKDRKISWLLLQIISQVFIRTDPHNLSRESSLPPSGTVIACAELHGAGGQNKQKSVSVKHLSAATH